MMSASANSRAISHMREMHKSRTYIRLLINSDRFWLFGKVDRVVISEDGDSTTVRKYINSIQHEFKNLTHLYQKDMGFRKNAALNRAAIAATADYLVFIDGDCVPHKKFMESHLRNAEYGTVCSGRRVELGPKLSRYLVTQPDFYHAINNPFFYSLKLVPALLDHVKNFEAGVYSKFIHQFNKHKKPNILGCNCTGFL